MSFDFLDDVFLLYLPLKAAQGIFEGFSLLQSDFCQLNYTPKLVLMGQTFIARFCNQVKRYCDLEPDWRVVRSPAYSIRAIQCTLNKSGAKPAEAVAERKRRSLS
jgi:hypothetical protein